MEASTPYESAQQLCQTLREHNEILKGDGLRKRFFHDEALFRVSEFAEGLGLKSWSGVSIHDGTITTNLDFRFERFDDEDKVVWSGNELIIFIIFPSEEIIAEYAAPSFDPSLEMLGCEQVTNISLMLAERASGYPNLGYQEFVRSVAGCI